MARHESTGGPMLEHGGIPGAGAVASLARWSGLSFDEVRAYLAAGKLNELIVETRMARGEPVVHESLLPKIEWLYRKRELRARQFGPVE
jgi:hypothetical protein